MANMGLGRHVLVIGCCGAGKSTLAKRVAKRTGLPLVHLDCLYWKPNWEHVTSEELRVLVEVEMEKNSDWIIEGNYNNTLPWRLTRCDSVIWLDYSRFVCLLSVLRRWAAKHTDRSDITRGCDERWDWPFFWFVWTFKRKHNARYACLMEEAAMRGVTVYRLKSRKAAEKLLASLRDKAA